MVPRQYIALLRRERSARMRAEYGPAMIVSALTALMSKKPSNPSKFMPSLQQDAKQEKPWQDQMATMRGALEALGGR